jgi:hypothetical protein
MAEVPLLAEGKAFYLKKSGTNDLRNGSTAGS